MNENNRERAKTRSRGGAGVGGAALAAVLLVAGVGVVWSASWAPPGAESERGQVSNGQADPKSDVPPKPKSPKPESQKPESQPPKIDERGFLNLGTVRLHQKKKIIEADGWFNMDRGVVEFLACAPGVKSHETLIALDINPIEFNFALLSIGLEPGTPPKNEVDLRPIAGDRVVLFLKFKKENAEGKPVEVTRRVEDCLINFLNEEDMEHVGFVYTGAQFIPKHPEAEPFNPNNPASERRAKEAAEKAEAEKKKGAGDGGDDPTEKQPEMIYAPVVLGQYITLCHRPFAILDNPLALPYPDPEYGANSEVLPRITRREGKLVPVTLIVRLPKKGEIDRSIKRMPFKMPEGYGEDDDGRDKKDGDKKDEKQDKEQGAGQQESGGQGGGGGAARVKRTQCYRSTYG